MMISVADVCMESMVDGEGVRAVLFGAGCTHACMNCHNPQSWDIDNGTWVSLQYIFDDLGVATRKLLDGVTFSGGDPMYQAAAFCELAKMIHAVPNRDVWCYTGYVFEDLINFRDAKYELLINVDVLVDGLYIHELRDLTLGFRGSSNQRIIDVRESLKHGTAIEYVVRMF